MRWFAAFALGLLLALAAPAAVPGAGAQEPVDVRGETGDGHVRLVFDWTTPVSFSAEIFDGVLIVRFARPFDAGLDGAIRQLSSYLAAGAIRPDRRTAVFALKRPLTFRSGPAGTTRAVIELIELKPPAAAASAEPRPSAQPSPAKPSPAKATPAKPPAAVVPSTAPAPGAGPSVASAAARPSGGNARVQLGQSSDGTRLEIDFGRPVTAQARENGRNVVVSFDTKSDLELGDLADRSLKLIEGIDASYGRSGPSLSLTLADHAQLKQSRSGNRVILDVVPAPERPAVASAAPVPRAQKPEPVPQPGSARRPDAAAKPEALKKPEPKAPPPKAERPEPQAEKSEPPSPPPAATRSEPSPAEQARAPSPADTDGGRKLTVGARVGDGHAVLRFPWGEPVAAAAFRRGLQVWIVFDRPARLDLAALRSVPTNLIGGAQQTMHADAAAMRLFLPPTINPTLARDGNAWTIDLRVQPMRPERAIALAPRRSDTGMAELALSVEQPGRSIALRDPDVGDQLIVVPVPTPGLGVAGTREYAEFRVLDSAQGIAVEPIADRVAVDTAPDLVRVAAPGGLNLSVRDAQRRTAADSPEGPRLAPEERVFAFQEWARGGISALNDNRRKLNLALSLVPPERRNVVRLEMAQLYFANLMGNDALGMMERIEADEPGEATDARFRALKGAAQLMARRFADAAKTLADPRLKDNNEVKLWRAMTARQLGEESASHAFFREAGFQVPEDYPPTLRLGIALKAAEAALADAGPGVAGVLVDHVADLAAETAEKGEIEYLRGRIAAAAGDKDKARELWTQAVARREPPSWARAELGLVQLGLEDKSLTREAAIDRLERLRYGWRGDDLERKVLALLAKLQIEGGHDAAGLSAYRDLVTLYPESGEARAAADEMGKSFVRLFVEGGADALPPLKALGLYDSFRELTPAGPKGDELIRKLADRVAGIDLLGRAGELLDDLVRRRLTGEAKAETGARLALIRLQNNEPAQALEALDHSRVEPVPEALKRQRAQLRARALYQLAKPAEALAAIADDRSEAAERLRQDIHWRQGNWAEAAKVALHRAERATGGGAPAPDAKLTEDAAAAIMSAAVASALADDKSALAVLRQRYAQAMDQTAYKSPFRLIANGGGSPADLAQVARTLEAAQGFQKYLADVKPAMGGAKDAPKQPDAAGKLN